MIQVADRLYAIGPAPQPIRLPPMPAAHRALYRRLRWQALRRQYGTRVLCLAVVVATVVAVAVTAWAQWPAPAVTVALTGTAPPALETDIRATIANALDQLEGVNRLAPHQVDGATPQAIHTATGAEVLWYRVTGEDTVLLGYRGKQLSFSVPAAATGARQLLIDAIPGHVRALFSWRRSAGRPLLDVDPATWATYLDLRRSELQPTDDLYWEQYLWRLERHVNAHPDNTDARARAIFIARYLFQRDHDHQYLERGQALLKHVTLHDPRLIYAAADLAIAAGDADQAEQLAVKLPLAHAGRPWLLSQVAQQRGDSEGRLRILQNAVADGFSPTWWYLLHLGNAELESGLFASARDAYQRLLILSPANLNGLDGAASVELFAGDVAMALRLYESLIVASPQPQYYFSAANACVALGDYASALTHLRSAEALGYRHPNLYLDRADCYTLMTGTTATAVYEHVLRLTEGDRTFWGQVNRAKAYASLGRAAEALDTLLRLSPDTPLESYSLADAYSRLGRPEAGYYASQAREAGLSPPWFSYLTVVAVVGEQSDRGQP